MIQSEKLKEHARCLRLYNIANRMDSILHHAQEETDLPGIPVPGIRHRS